jgi:hypothetical protein
MSLNGGGAARSGDKGGRVTAASSSSSEDSDLVGVFHRLAGDTPGLLSFLTRPHLIVAGMICLPPHRVLGHVDTSQRAVSAAKIMHKSTSVMKR